MTSLRVRVLARLPEADPLAVLAALRPGSAPALLDDARRGAALLAWAPDRHWSTVLRPGPPTVDPGWVASPGQRWPLASRDPARELECVALGEEWSCEAELPFWGGWIGYFGFECGHAFLPYPWVPRGADTAPHARFARYPRSLCFQAGETLVLGPESDAGAWVAEARAALDAAAGPRIDEPGPMLSSLHFPASPTSFQARVASLRAAIGAGELFQANLSHRAEARCLTSPRALYSRVRQGQPTAMSAYQETPRGRALLSWSPESFLSWRGDRVLTRPIKGTAPRGRHADEDQARAVALDESEKERAELTMIVDMARNDLGQLAVPGSVEVRSAGELESFPTLFHRTATIAARLRGGVGLAELLRATFPPASVTGAPKVRALQAIAELEAEERGPYCGAFGCWLPGAARADFSVLIRTAVVGPEGLSTRVGAGIVWDSNPQAEWEETLLKARYLEGAAHGATPLRVG